MEEELGGNDNENEKTMAQNEWGVNGMSQERINGERE